MRMQIPHNLGMLQTNLPKPLAELNQVFDHEMLRRNAELNNLPNLKVNQMGLWKSDSANLQFVGDDALAASEEISAQTEDSFQATTIDSYLKANGVSSVDLIMIDIEGGEFNALQGAKEQLALPVGTAPNVVFEIHSLYTDWAKGLQKAGYATDPQYAAKLIKIIENLQLFKLDEV